MKIYPTYKHKDLYIQMMKDLVGGKLSGLEFSDKFLSQRARDLEADRAILCSEEQEVIDAAENKWLSKEISYAEYLSICNTVVGPINNLFLELYGIIQSNDIEDFRAYFYAKKYRYARDIAKDRRVDEKELRRRIQEKLDLLEANKGKW